MYTRIALGLHLKRIVSYLSIYIAVGWVATEIAFFTACTPFNAYWSMPPSNIQCSTLQYYAIVQGSFNISSDALMLSFPLLLIMRLPMPWKQKIVLGVVFSLGIFVILAAILTKVFNLTNIFDPTYMLWYIRESSVAIYVANLPMIWPLLCEWFPGLNGLAQTKRALPVVENGHSATHAMSNISKVPQRVPDSQESTLSPANDRDSFDNGIVMTISSIDESTEKSNNTQVDVAALAPGLNGGDSCSMRRQSIRLA
ncbi:hypothetical protein BP6252_11152 [Coleophoma cylindrospora]|uniref:Rhodopsin domain-containing protein n=1 Tax=Coleophoma cylindrospora TaxID=1849047 RepID=A0A3D8QP92_9HELO|nr:hypothetical protein BP6252_11152 [Coleophoma cylindrospora]